MHMVRLVLAAAAVAAALSQAPMGSNAQNTSEDPASSRSAVVVAEGRAGCC